METTGSNGHHSSSKRTYKVVFTGGPCGGKTTGQSCLSTFFENLGWKVYRVSEAAFILLGGGVKFADLSEPETIKFQENLLLTILQLEKVFFDLARTCDRNCLIICDRGTMDASAYISAEGWEQILANNNLNHEELRDTRYNQIIHMVSAAVGAEAFYTTEDNITRSENIALAQELDQKAAQAWIGHPYFDVIDNTSDFDTKIKRMISMVCQKMGVDTGDRLKNNARKIKYLVQGPMPSIESFKKFQDFTVEHIYLRTNSRKMQARIRKRGALGNHTYTYTIRKPEKLGQIVEVRTQVTQRDWNTAKSQADDSHFHIYKTRRCFLHNDQYFQLDIYREPCHQRCQGLMLLETYSTLAPDEMTQRLPSFLNIVKEVTGNPEYSMFNLSLHADWSTSTKFCVNIAGKETADQSTESSTVGRRVSHLAAEPGDDSNGRRVSESDTEWHHWRTKMVEETLQDDHDDHSDDENKVDSVADDEFYEDMDKRYNGNRVLEDTGNGLKETCDRLESSKINGV